MFIGEGLFLSNGFGIVILFPKSKRFWRLFEDVNMSDGLRQPEHHTNHTQRLERRTSKQWVWPVLLAVIVIGVFLSLQKRAEQSPQDRIDEFFTLDKIVRSDLPEEKLIEYKHRMSDAKANMHGPDGDINFRSYMEAASVKKGVGDYEGARDIWEYVNEKRPKNSVSFANLGDLYANFLKNPVRAEQNYLKAIENDPSDPGYLRGLLELYQYQLTSRLGFSEEIFKKAAETNKEIPDFWLILANYYELAKNYDMAIEAWKKIPELDPAMRASAHDQIQRIEGLTK